MATNDFNFDAFNQLVNGKPAGLQIFLAQQLIANALWSMEKYDNPRSEDVQGIFTEIKTLRATLKADAEARNKNTGVVNVADIKG